MFGFVWRDVLAPLRLRCSHNTASTPLRPATTQTGGGGVGGGTFARVYEKWGGWQRLSQWLGDSDVRLDLTVGVVVRPRRSSPTAATTAAAAGAGGQQQGWTGLHSWQGWRDRHAASSFILLSFE